MSDIELNNKLLMEMFMKIRQIEGQNLKTGKYDDKEMRKYIEKIIRDCVEKEDKNEI